MPVETLPSRLERVCPPGWRTSQLWDLGPAVAQLQAIKTSSKRMSGHNDMTSDLYREQILDHYGNPRNEGTLEDADLSHERDNPVCGDVVRLDINFEDGVVSEAAFSGQGCVISIASASMFTERIVGKTIDELRAMDDEDVFEMLGVELGPSRANCGVLPLRVLQEALAQWEANREDRPASG